MQKQRTVRETETIETRSLRVFERVAELKSLTRAAAELGMPKSVVSKELTRLEQRLEVTLLERTSRRIEITLAGQTLLYKARSLLGELDALTRDLQSQSTELRGELTICVSPDLAAILTSRLFPAFIRQHPEVRICLQVDYGYVDMFNPGLDLAIRIGPVQDDRLVAKRITSLRRVLVASPDWAAANPLNNVADLAHVSALIFSEQGPHTRWRLTDGRRTHEVEVSGVIRARSFPVLLRAAEAGLGVTIAPELLVEDQIESGRLVRVLAQLRSPEIPIQLVHRIGQSRIRRVAAFIEFAQRHAQHFAAKAQ
jgi:DNA-binding transcriptional LysR family regulator